MKQARLAVIGLLLLSTEVDALDEEQRRQMQEQLNSEVMARPFDPGDVEKAKHYADEAMKKDLQPVKTPPAYWQPGWTCSHLSRYRYYRYRDYRNCVYYHRYYGRYW